jgi:hypothetical protein
MAIEVVIQRKKFVIENPRYIKLLPCLTEEKKMALVDCVPGPAQRHAKAQYNSPVEKM